MFSSFIKRFNYPGPEPPDGSIPATKAAAKIFATYFAIIYTFSYYLNNVVCSCQINALPRPLQSVLDFLFTLFLNDINNGSVRNINCFKTVIVFSAFLTVIFAFVFWHFEKERLIKTAEKGILNNDCSYKIPCIFVMVFTGFIVVPYIFILNADPKPGPKSSSQMFFYLYNDINYWVPQATRACVPFLCMSFAIIESWAQIIARKNIRQQKG